MEELYKVKKKKNYYKVYVLLTILKSEWSQPASTEQYSTLFSRLYSPV